MRKRSKICVIKNALESWVVLFLSLLVYQRFLCSIKPKVVFSRSNPTMILSRNTKMVIISQTSIDDHELGLARSVMKGNTEFPVASFKSFKRRMSQSEQHMCIFEDEEARRYGYLENKVMRTLDKICPRPTQFKPTRSASISLGELCANKNCSGKLRCIEYIRSAYLLILYFK